MIVRESEAGNLQLFAHLFFFLLLNIEMIMNKCSRCDLVWNHDIVCWWSILQEHPVFCKHHVGWFVHGRIKKQNFGFFGASESVHVRKAWVVDYVVPRWRDTPEAHEQLDG